MYKRKIEVCCAATLLITVSFLMINYHGWVSSRWYPSGILIIPLFLGGVAGFIGICLIAKSVWSRQPFRIELVFASGLNIFFVMMFQQGVGWQSIDFREGNDYSTDIASIPQYQFINNQMNSVKKAYLVSAIPSSNVTVKADKGTISLPLSALASKRIIRKATHVRGWLITRYLVLSTDDIESIEIFQLTARMPLSGYRSDVVIRSISDKLGSTKIDIRASWLNNKRDFGLNNVIINVLTTDILNAAYSSSSTEEASHSWLHLRAA